MEIIGCGGICYQSELPSPENLSGINGYLMNIYTLPGMRVHGNDGIYDAGEAGFVGSKRMKKAWEIARELFENAEPVLRTEEEQTWTDNVDVSGFYDQNLSLDWGSRVPGSGAPEKIMVAAIQALENRGYAVSEEGYRYLAEGLEAFDRKDFAALHRFSALLRRELAQAAKDPGSGYWKYRQYAGFAEYQEAVSFPAPGPVDVSSARFREQIRAGWLCQLIDGAFGTMVEGYTSEKLLEAYGEVYDYLREPNTYNDDTTYELAFLDAFMQKGYAVTAEDIALGWAGYIPCGWSAEEIAIRNIKNGIFPPESGQFRNPFNEWIGAQMRGGICGMAAPGDPGRAAELAWKDGCISHANNGILGEIFSAVLTSLSFTGTDVRKILRTAVGLIPADSEYRSVLDYAWARCEESGDFREALRACGKKYEKYNWIHAYPNACCLVIALYFGEGDFARTLHIVTMCGLDADCNAGVVMPVIGISRGMGAIPEKYLHPAFDELTTYMRGRWARTSLEDLTDMTVTAVAQALSRKE